MSSSDSKRDNSFNAIVPSSSVKKRPFHFSSQSHPESSVDAEQAQ
jgi:hypothetical protein